MFYQPYLHQRKVNFSITFLPFYSPTLLFTTLEADENRVVFPLKIVGSIVLGWRQCPVGHSRGNIFNTNHHKAKLVWVITRFVVSLCLQTKNYFKFSNWLLILACSYVILSQNKALWFVKYIIYGISSVCSQCLLRAQFARYRDKSIYNPGLTPPLPPLPVPSPLLPIH